MRRSIYYIIYIYIHTYGGFHKYGGIQNGWFRRENLTKMDDLEVPLFQETTISTHVSSNSLMWACTKIWDRTRIWCRFAPPHRDLTHEYEPVRDT